MEDPQRILNPIIFNSRTQDLQTAFNQASQVLRLAKVESKTILENAKISREKIYEESRAAGQSKGYTEVFERLMDIAPIYNKILGQLASDIQTIVEQIVCSLFAQDSITSTLVDEMKNRILRLISDLQNENLDPEKVINVRVPVGRKSELSQILTKFISVEKIVECETCGNLNLTFETKFGSIESIPQEHLRNLLFCLEEKLRSNKKLKDLAHSVCEEIVSMPNLTVIK